MGIYTLGCLHRGRDSTHLHSPCQGLRTKRRCFPLVLSFRDHIGRLSDVVEAVSPATSVVSDPPFGKISTLKSDSYFKHFPQVCQGS
jgi:hypothetical protein